MFCDHCFRLCVVFFIGCLVINALLIYFFMWIWDCAYLSSLCVGDLVRWNKIASDIKLVFYSSTITMMHGPINIRFNILLTFYYIFNKFYALTYNTVHYPRNALRVTTHLTYIDSHKFGHRGAIIPELLQHIHNLVYLLENVLIIRICKYE